MQRAIHEYAYLYSDRYKQFLGLTREKMEIEPFISLFKNNDVDHLKIRRIVEERIDFVLINNIYQSCTEYFTNMVLSLRMDGTIHKHGEHFTKPG